MGICPLVETRLLDQSRQSPIGAVPSTVWGHKATRSSTLVQSVWLLEEQLRRPSEPAFRLLEPVGSMKDKVDLNPPGSARYGPRLRQSADPIDRAVAKAALTHQGV